MLEGVGIGLALTAAVGVMAFWLGRKLPYWKMLIGTGILVGFVLVVMIGGTALSFADLGWIPKHETPFAIPGWMGSWFEIYPVWETLAAHVLAAVFVVGSYFLAEELKSRRPGRKGLQPAEVATEPPPKPPAVQRAPREHLPA